MYPVTLKKHEVYFSSKGVAAATAIFDTRDVDMYHIASQVSELLDNKGYFSMHTPVATCTVYKNHAHNWEFVLTVNGKSQVITVSPDQLAALGAAERCVNSAIIGKYEGPFKEIIK